MSITTKITNKVDKRQQLYREFHVSAKHG